DAMARPVPSRYRSQLRLELTNGSRVLCLPGREQTIRSFGGVSLLILDEAARVPHDLYRSVRPMLAVSGGRVLPPSTPFGRRGRLIALSTPFGRRGWFYHEWAGAGPWRRFNVSWRECPRITEAFIADERRALGDGWVAQEYEATFTTLEGLVYPGFERALTDV